MFPLNLLNPISKAPSWSLCFFFGGRELECFHFIDNNSSPAIIDKRKSLSFCLYSVKCCRQVYSYAFLVFRQKMGNSLQTNFAVIQFVYNTMNLHPTLTQFSEIAFENYFTNIIKFKAYAIHMRTR